MKLYDSILLHPEDVHIEGSGMTGRLYNVQKWSKIHIPFIIKVYALKELLQTVFL